MCKLAKKEREVHCRGFGSVGACTALGAWCGHNHPTTAPGRERQTPFQRRLEADTHPPAILASEWVSIGKKETILSELIEEMLRASLSL